MSKVKATTREIEFACHAPEAQCAFLAGTFNDWQTDATPMEKNAEGEWTTFLDLPPGRYEFKFVVDGEWVCEPGSDPCAERPKCVANKYGTMNHVIEVASQ